MGICAIFDPPPVPVTAGWPGIVFEAAVSASVIGTGTSASLECVEVFTEIACVTDADGITLAAFDCRGDGLAADGTFHDFIHVTHRQAIAGGDFAVGREVEEITARRALGENAARSRKIAQRFLNLHRHVLNRAEVRAKTL